MATARREARSLFVEPYSADSVVKRRVSLDAYHTAGAAADDRLLREDTLQRVGAGACWVTVRGLIGRVCAWARPDGSSAPSVGLAVCAVV